MAEPFDPDAYTKGFSITAPYHRTIYPSVAPTNPALSFRGKVVLITGASRNVGRGIAPTWAAAGAAGIVVTARKVESLDAVTQDIKAAGAATEVLAVACDVRSDASVQALFAAIKEKFGRLDVVIANAGIMGQGAAFPKIGEGDAEAWWDDINTNIRGTHLTAHHYIATFGAAGTFVSLTSGAAALTLPGMSSYAIAKHACIRIVEFLAAEHPSLRAFALNPGIVKDTDTVPAFRPFALDTVELIGGFALWLASGRADGVKGGYVSVNWDVDVLERNADVIREKGLLGTAFLNVKFGAEGSVFE
ncbi:NAD(P)-binding protein [Melanomma pulvis-pyrius CBS 109.77]|uniref:NAD(P)-binding protein n=1 Tax=Melanomma pulvis-pyrius CBS 109.77 TaxID=1314802 RepID=A0A6A6WSB4_9PLEO|nr:NAD(P)-binding protein [Melanomma pulvis-pyrius CBS 109.77]